MTKEKIGVYRKLQQHLDNQAVRFPKTRSGAELKVLQHIFTPEEAKIVACLSYKFEPLETIYHRAGETIDSLQSLKKTLSQIQKKGGIESKVAKGRRLYCNTPLVVGMYEFQVERLTPEFIKDFNDYTSDINFGLGFLSTELPQMRTIPVAKSITPEHHISLFDEVAVLLQQADGPFVVVECICRKKNALAGQSCNQTHRDETCLAIGSMAQMVMDSGIGRTIQREEAFSIIEQNQRDGLILQPSNTEKAEFICSCCGCCCGMLGIHQKLPKPLKFWATNFHAVVDAADCVGCGLCEDTCQVNAVSVSEKKQYATVDKNRCLGCGNCLSGCPTQAISLLKNPTETVPPKNREALFDIIKANQKGWFGTFMLAVQLVVDALRSGHTEILKPEKDIAPAQPACQPPTAETTDLGFKHEKGAQKKM